jgi:hypothetical protein
LEQRERGGDLIRDSRDDEPAEDELIEAVNGRSAELMIEARQYIAGVRQVDPKCSERQAFEGWAIQKLAGLQLLVEMLNMQLGELGAEMERRTGPAAKGRRPGR